MPEPMIRLVVRVSAPFRERLTERAGALGLSESALARSYLAIGEIRWNGYEATILGPDGELSAIDRLEAVAGELAKLAQTAKAQP